MSTPIPERLAVLPTLTFAEGAHDEDDGAMCVMEAVAWIAGEPWSDRPACVDPVIASFMRSWNDGLPSDEDRTRLLAPLVPLVIGTRSTPEVRDRRALMAADWAVRTYTPAWLRLAGLTGNADDLAALDELTTAEAFDAARRGPIAAARKSAAAARAAALAAAGAALAAAEDAALAAAGDAAEDAAWDAAEDARAAAWDAAGAAAGVALAAAGAAALAAARDAARDAARAAAWDALAPTVAELQASAVELVKRMCEVA